MPDWHNRCTCFGLAILQQKQTASFVQFWLDVIAEWEQENGKVLVDLAVNKDVQDAILKDPMRSRIVDIIDIGLYSNADNKARSKNP